MITNRMKLGKVNPFLSPLSLLVQSIPCGSVVLGGWELGEDGGRGEHELGWGGVLGKGRIG